MTMVNPSSINDLCDLVERGVPVTLTSHPGNASLYKLTLWSCGIPEHLWDVTCAKADANNWPMFELRGGNAHMLVSTAFHDRVMRETSSNNRFVTAYQYTDSGERLGRYHVRAMQQLFPHIRTYSELLLTEKERICELFSFLAETRNDVFTRYIDSDGVMRPIHESAISQKQYADTFMNVLTELDQLLNSDELIQTKGGACYDGVSVALAGMLVHYWHTDEIVRYDISGPDMIHYATTKGYAKSMQELLDHMRKWSKDLVPKHFHIQMLPGTLASVGHIPGHVSEEVMARKVVAIRDKDKLNGAARHDLTRHAINDNNRWPTIFNPRQTPYFSQHDLLAHGGTVVVDEFWKDIPISEIRGEISKANSILRIR